MRAWFQHLPSVGWEKEKSKNDSRQKGGSAKEWKYCIVTAQHLNECVFLGMLAPALKHENEHRLWHLGITVLRMDNPRVRLPSRSGDKTFTLTLGASVHVSTLVFVCAWIWWLHSHPRWTKWGPWVLSEMHNTEEASHIVRVMGVREVSLAFHCCGQCSRRFQLTHKKVSKILKRNTLES